MNNANLVFIIYSLVVCTIITIAIVVKHDNKTLDKRFFIHSMYTIVVLVIIDIILLLFY